MGAAAHADHVDLDKTGHSVPKSGIFENVEIATDTR